MIGGTNRLVNDVLKKEIRGGKTAWVEIIYFGRQWRNRDNINFSLGIWVINHLSIVHASSASKQAVYSKRVGKRAGVAAVAATVLLTTRSFSLWRCSYWRLERSRPLLATLIVKETKRDGYLGGPWLLLAAGLPFSGFSRSCGGRTTNQTWYEQWYCDSYDTWSRSHGFGMPMVAALLAPKSLRCPDLCIVGELPGLLTALLIEMYSYIS